MAAGVARLRHRAVLGEILVAPGALLTGERVADALVRLPGGVDTSAAVAFHAAHGALEPPRLADSEEHAAVDRLAHDPLHQVHPVALAPEADPALGAAGDKRTMGRDDRPAAPVEAVEGEPAEVGLPG